MRSRTSRKQRTTAAVAVLALALLGTACDTEPPPPAPQLTVTSAVDRSDANPGDGTCEATPGAGDCTVRAAIEEGNALGRADIVLAAGANDYMADGPTVTVTGAIHLTGPSTARVNGMPLEFEDPMALADNYIDVADGGSLSIAGVRLTGFQTRIASGGAFAALHTRIDTYGGLLYYAPSGPALSIAAGGSALVQSSIVGNLGSTSIINRGTLLVDQSTVGNHTLNQGALVHALQTTGAGTSYVRGSWLAGTGCTGTLPISMGYNAAVGTTCGLTGPSDVQNAPANTASSGSSVAPSGPLVDAIPLGEALCGTVLVDVHGNPRPTDGDGDGVAACDIGAREG